MRIVFMGTPEFAVPSLVAVAREHEVVMVVAQPGRPAGRGMKMQQPAVAVRAGELGLEVLQPAKIRDETALAAIEKMAPDLGIIVAYGKILPRRLLEIPRHGFVNVHGSILPKWRGAAPVQRAIEAGETTLGVTIMRVDEDLDHGPMFSVATLETSPDERLPAIAKRLAVLGSDALAAVLRDIEKGTAMETPQDHAAATHAAKIDKEEGRITFGEAALTIYNRSRAFDPWPGIFFVSGGETIKIAEMRPVDASGTPRTILAVGDDVTVATGVGALRLISLQRPGKPRASAGDIARGLGWQAGAPLA